MTGLILVENDSDRYVACLEIFKVGRGWKSHPNAQLFSGREIFGNDLLPQCLLSFYFSITVVLWSIAKAREVVEAFEPLKICLWARRMRQFLHTEASHSRE